MLQNNTYTVLEGAEKIRKNIGMYIGDDHSPMQLFTEVLDNMLDEIASKHANIGKIYFKKDSSEVWITDNGRGLHVYDMQLADGTIKKSVEILCTEIHSGSKFESNDYESHIGMHGVGLVAVNALSDWLIIKTRDRINKNIIHNFTFIDFILNKYEITEEINDNQWSTVVGFKPSDKFFESNTYDIHLALERLILCQSKYDHAQFYVNDKLIPKKDFVTLVKNDYFNIIDDTPVYELKYENNKQKIHILLTYTNKHDSILLGDVNLRRCTGKYIDELKILIRDTISNKVNKKYAESALNLYSLGLRLYVSLVVPRPKFSSQNKERMTLSVKNTLLPGLTQQVEWFINQKNILQIIENNLQSKLDEELLKTKIKKKYHKISPDNKLKDCIKTPGDVLYLVEGDSAEGTLKQIRNIETEALFPLRGKVLNVEKASLDKLQKNKEIEQLIQALGPKNNRRYKKIKIVADSDEDGRHIVVLLILLLYKIAPDYLESNNISVVLPPLYAAVKRNKFIPIYDYNEVEQYKQQNYDIKRFKGLGEMNANELEIAIRSNIEHIIKLPEDKSEIELLFKIVTESDIKRSLLNNKKCTYLEVINRVLTEIKTSTI